MISINIDDDCFVKIHGRVFRGVAVRFWENEAQVQVRTEAAARVFAPWQCMSFRLNDGVGDAARDALLVVPTTLAEWSELGRLADLKHVDPGWARRSLPKERPGPLNLPFTEPVAVDQAPWLPKRVMVDEPPAPRVSLPYADDDDDRRVMKPPEVERPEGWEEGEG